MILKRATKKVEHLGLEIHKGLYGPYIYDPTLALGCQRGIVYPSTEEAIKQALTGVRPELKIENGQRKLS